MISPPTNPPAPRAARLALGVVFFGCGLPSGSWVARIPAVQHQLGLDPATLGLALLGWNVGSVGALLVSGWLVTQIGSRKTTFVSHLALARCIPLIPFAANVLRLGAALAAYVFCSGVLNVGANAFGPRVALGSIALLSFAAAYLARALNVESAVPVARLGSAVATASEG